MRCVAVLYNEPSAASDPAETDVLAQVEAVVDALTDVGEIVTIGVTLDLAALDEVLARRRPDVVFNLVEALGGSDRLGTLVPLLLDARRIPYTGAGLIAQLGLADKVVAKARLRAAGLPTPDWYVAGTPCSFPGSGAYIVKARQEHASLGMDDDAIAQATAASDLEAAIKGRAQDFATPFFAERFVSGREFNLALLQGEDDSVEVLPPAEIDFSAFADDKPRIVGWDAKWSEGSFEYDCTPRRFDFPAEDAALLDRLRDLARDAWDLFGLSGYARVDFRVDEAGRPWILELNFNPCLSPDAGFAAALGRAGISFEDAIGRLIATATAS
jgi:D-alanine-D-alanine ligase